MKWFTRAIVLPLFLLPGLAGAQDSAFRKSYKALFENPSSSSINYRILRDAYTQEPTFNPDFERYDADLGLMGQNYQKGNYAESVKYAKKVIDADPCNTSAHSALGANYKALGNKRLSELHNKFYNGLARSIIESGEFGNPKKPFHVITRYEIYAIIDYLDMQLETLVPVMDADNGFGVWAHVTNKDKQKGVLYFEINKIENWKKRKK